MPWLVLLTSAVLEAVWATALGRSDGFTEPGPTMVFVLALAASMLGLAIGVRSIPIGTAYAVWTGVGAALTVAWAAATGAEPLSPVRALCIAGIVAATVGLTLLPAHED